MKHTFQKIAFLFPGQGAQYIGMGGDFAQNFSAARLTFEEADQLLERPLSHIISQGPADLLTETKNSQAGIYVTSMSIFRVIKELYEITPFVCAGLSLGEYSALTGAEILSFRDALPLVQLRGQWMNEACEQTNGGMAVIMGLDAEVVQQFVKELQLPNDLWVANYNCPGQVVISGTEKGIAAGTEAAKKHMAKRVLPLQVHGAFHSGLMSTAREKLAPFIEKAAFLQGSSQLVMNVPGDFVKDLSSIRYNLINQVTHSVKWEQGIRAMEREGVDLYIEFGPGKTLSGMNKRIGVQAPNISIEKVEDLKHLESILHNKPHS